MAGRIYQTKAKIVRNTKLEERYYKIALSCSDISRTSQPGQFVQIKVAEGIEPLLRRPFSIHRIDGNKIEILYEVVGKGSEILSQRKAGEYLDVIGPLGNGFNYELRVTSYALPILVGGGMGVAPLVFLAEKIMKLQISDCRLQIIVLIGAKTKSQILCKKEFKKLGCQVKIATDDGSKGFKGKATGLLKHLLSTIDYRLSTIYACGPRPMLREISAISRQQNIPAQISLEEHMACGIGACFGCAVGTKDGYKRVCKEGPVFKAEEITW